jgi:hypothetical protein
MRDNRSGLLRKRIGAFLTQGKQLEKELSTVRRLIEGRDAIDNVIDFVATIHTALLPYSASLREVDRFINTMESLTILRPRQSDLYYARDLLAADFRQVLSLLENLSIDLPRRARRQEDPLMSEVKQEVVDMLAAKYTHKEICDRLGDRPRPRKAKWSRLTWPEAYRLHLGSVKVWISKLAKPGSR